MTPKRLHWCNSDCAESWATRMGACFHQGLELDIDNGHWTPYLILVSTGSCVLFSGRCTYQQRGRKILANFGCFAVHLLTFWRKYCGGELKFTNIRYDAHPHFAFCIYDSMYIKGVLKKLIEHLEIQLSVWKKYMWYSWKIWKCSIQ